MIQLSDANPIHIFYEDEPTFNEDRVDNIEHECYIHEHQCDEPVLEQVFDDESDDEYDWVFYDNSDNEVHRIEMTQEEITAAQEVDDFEDFENIGTGTVNWTIDETPSVVIPDAPFFTLTKTKNLAPPNTFAFEVGKIYRFNFNLTKDAEVGSLSLVLLDEDGGILQTSGIAIGGAGTFDVSVDVTIPEFAVRFGLYVQRLGQGGSAPNLDLSFNSYSIERVAYVHTVEFTASELDFCDERLRFEVLRRTDDAVFGHTDRVFFPTEVSSSVLILYKCNKNFAGLIYNEYSEYRYIRIKGRFYHPARSGSAAFSEQSNGTVTTRNWTMKKKKILEVQDCPEYLNTKIDLVLAHCVDGDVSIKEVSWEFSDGDVYEYEGAADRPDTYPFQAGKARLTRKNYFKQNTI